jgi:mono/diheme cytochrome c family protein
MTIQKQNIHRLSSPVAWFGVACAALASLIVISGSAIARADSDRVSYNRDIRPIFSENCVKCHGPDSGRRKAGLRLDQAESTHGVAKSGAIPVVPGSPEKSELIRRITATDQDQVMPPPSEHKPLKPAEIALLKRWIAEGGKYEGHWAYQRIQSPPVPSLQSLPGFQIENAIDAYVLARLQKEGLSPSAQEEKARLLRRVSLDLTGLPPTLEEVDAFVADTAPTAYEKVVDRLLASPHFGERFAVPWLDLARHSDTGGYHNDSLRTTWMWRDWVVKAFNDNKPFDQFTIEQIAGDLLPNATIDNKLASGFMRNVMTSDEGGIIDAEYLNLYIVDRVNTLGTTWLGITVNCGQCHDHKYDPVTQRDYYSLYAFFHNVPENGKDGVRDRNPVPRLFFAPPAQQKRIAQFELDVKAAEQEIQGLTRGLSARQAQWERQVASQKQDGEAPGPWSKFPLIADGSGVTDILETIECKPVGRTAFAGKKAKYSFQSDGKSWLDYGQHFGFEKDQPFAVAAWVNVSARGGSPFGKMDNSSSVRGWDVEFHGTNLSVHLIHQWPNDAIHVQVEKPLIADMATHVAFSYDGSGKAAGLKVFVNGMEEKTKVLVDNLTGTIKTPAPFSIGRRGGAAAPFYGSIHDLRLYERKLTGMEIAALGGAEMLAIAATPKASRTAQQNDQLQKFFRENVATDYAAATRKLADLQRDKSALEKQTLSAMVMVEMEKPRDTFVKIRGQYDKNGEKVTANTPQFLPPLPSEPINGKRYTRLDLAKWLVSPEQPLVARVEVNRWWAVIFGTGIVKSLNDFGSQGEWPSHPELLEWMAADFARDWNIKRVLKQMVMSSTYCQSSRVTREMLERDSANRLLAHGPRNRLDAEFIRDNALAISGLLNPEIGGEPVFPIQPPGIWDQGGAASTKWTQEHDDRQYRRAIYIYHRRSTPYPSMLTFDAPSREVCTAIRARSSTPLQSLVLMNDPVYVEAARGLAQRTLKESSLDTGKRLEYMWRQALARPINSAQRTILEQSLNQQLERYRQDKPAAEALTKVGDLPRFSNVDVSELAAWTAVASVILNLNETITN